MKNFRYIFVSSVSIFIINFLVHFMYQWIPNDLIGIFFPTNESIFQHMKMVFTSFFIFYFILFQIKRKFKFENLFSGNLIAATITITFFLIIYIPVYFRFGESMIWNLTLLFISIFIGQFLSYFILKKDDFGGLSILSISLTAIVFIIAGYLTFHPIENFLFWDPEHETYEKVLK